MNWIIGGLLLLVTLVGCNGSAENKNQNANAPQGTDTSPLKRPKLDLKLAFDMEEESQAGVSGVLPELVDVANATGLEFQYYSDDQSGKLNFPEVFGGGVACLDYDLDGVPDVFLPNGTMLPFDEEKSQYRDQIFRNTGAKWSNVSTSARIAGVQYSHGCSYGDVNEDGFDDLLIANLGTCELLINQGDGTFIAAEVPELAAEHSWWMVPVLADLDSDRHVDLLLVPYVDWKQTAPLSKQVNGPGYPGPNEFSALPIVVLKNGGEGTWRNTTQSLGLNKVAKGMAVAVADFDGDRKAEIYIANDSISNSFFTRSRNLLFDPKITNASRSSGNRNQMRTIDEVSSQVWSEIGEVSGTAAGGTGVTEASMSATVADFDGNMQVDLLVTNYFGRPNSLYTNRGHLNFRNIAHASRMDSIGKAFLTFGAVAFDYDLDGAWDVLTANGHVLGPNAAVHQQTSQVLRNVDGAFIDVSSVAGDFFQKKGLGRSVGSIDFDADGDSDLIVTFSDGPTSLLENRTQRNAAWISIEVADHRHFPMEGGRIEIWRDNQPVSSVAIVAGGSYLSDSQKQWTFGLAEALKIGEGNIEEGNIGEGNFASSENVRDAQSVQVKVYWPDGLIDDWEEVAVNRRYRCLPGRMQLLKTKTADNYSDDGHSKGDVSEGSEFRDRDVRSHEPQAN